MPKVSAEHKEGVRRRIMDAALACLERNGYRNLTTRELLAEAGLSVGTFYNYFPTKEHLYEALAEEALGGDIDRIRRGTAEGVPTGQALLAFLRDLATHAPSGTVAMAAFRGRMNAEPEARDAIARLNRWVVEEFSPLIEQAQAEGSIRPDLDPRAVVELIDIIWDGIGRRAATDTFETSYQAVGRMLI
ncbi:MAG: TetR/AcrR family transcriptional regulator, partial [Acidimicrobiales bacterium]